MLMKRYSILPIFLLFCFIFLIPIISWAASPNRITFAEGRVDVLKTGSNAAIQVKQGDSVDVGDIYRAKSNGRAEITFANNNLLKIAPNTRIEIQEAMFQGDKNISVVKLHRGRVQAISSEEFVKKVSSLAEQNKFEVHTPNAVAGIRGSNMVVGFLRGVTSTLFLKGFGYQYNPNDPQKRTITLTQGQISFVITITSPPTPARNASEAEIMIQVQAVTPRGQSEGTGTGSTSTTPGGGGYTGPTITTSTGAQTEASSFLAALLALFAPPAPPPPPPPPPPEPSSDGESAPSPTFQSIATGSLYAYPGSSLVREGFYYGLLKGYGTLWSATQSAPIAMKIVDGEYTAGAQPSHIFGSDTTLSSYNSRNSTYTTYDGGSFYGYTGGYEVGNSIIGKKVSLYIDPSGNIGYLKGSYSGQGNTETGKFNVNGTLYPVSIAAAAGILPANLMSSTWAPSSGTGGLAGIFASGGSLAGLTNLTFDTMAIYNSATNAGQNWGIYRFIDYGSYSNSSGSTTWSGKTGGTGIFGAAYGSSGFVDDSGRWIADITSGAWSGNALTGSLSGKFISYTKLGTIVGDLLGSYNTGGTWQAMSLGTWSGTPLTFYGSLNPALWYTANGSAWTQSGSLNARMGSITSLWNTNSGSPAVLYLLGSYSESGSSYHIFNYDLSSYNHKTGENTTYDSTAGSFRNMYSGIKLNDSIESKIAGLYIDPSGNAGFVKGSFAGLSYPQLLMWDASGNMYITQMATNIGITPKNLNNNIWDKSISGNISESFFSATGGGSSYNKTFSIYNAATNIAQPWGIWQFSFLGTYTSPAASWTAKIGGEGTFGAYYATSFNNDSGYWIADISSGTWANNRAAGSISGKYITKTRLGTIDGELLATYNTGLNWQGVGIGSWSGSDLGFLSCPSDSAFSFKYFNGSSLASRSGTNTGYHGGLAGLWSATQASPLSTLMIGTYSAPSSTPNIWASTLTSTSFKTGTTTTYDGGIYSGYLIGSEVSGNLDAKLAALGISPSGNAGYIRGGLSGNGYSGINYFGMTNGSMYYTQKTTGVTSLNTVSWTDSGSNSTYASLYGIIGSGGYLSSYTTSNILLTTAAIKDSSTSVLPWGIYKFTDYGSSSNSSGATTWSAKVGGGGYGGYEVFGKYYNSSLTPALTDDYGYWLADLTSGTSTGSKIFAGLSGSFLTKTKLGTMTGDFLGTYNSNSTWQAGSVGVWEGNDLSYFGYYLGFSQYHSGTGGFAADGSMSFNLGGTTSLFGSTAAGVTVIGQYNPGSNSSYPNKVWSAPFNSYNIKNSSASATTFDGGAFRAFFGGTVIPGTTEAAMDGRLYGLYEDSSKNAGFIYGDVSGTGYNNIKMFGMTGTINKTEIDTGLSGSTSTFTTANIGYKTFSGGTILEFNLNSTAVGSPQNQDIIYNYVIEKGNWGVWQTILGGSGSSGTDTWNSDFLVKNNASYEILFGLEMAGTKWSSNKITGTAYGYGADSTTFSSPITWISVGDIKGTYNPSYFQTIAMGPWIETNKFINMACPDGSCNTTGTGLTADQQKLQALNIPCVQVGSDTLSYSLGGLSLNLTGVKFFSTTSNSSVAPKIWATNDVSGSWNTGYGPNTSTAYNMAGTNTSASMNFKKFADTANTKWTATITNGSGTINGASTTFRGVAAGTVGTNSLTGTAAGTAKPGGQ